MKTKERIEKLERELAELKKELNPPCTTSTFADLKKPEIKVGDWVTFDNYPKHMGYVTETGEGRYYYYGLNTGGEWQGIDFYRIEDNPRKATDKEVRGALIKEAKRRGFKEGDIVKTNNQEYSITRELDSANYYGNDAEFHPNSLQCGAIIFQNGQWGDIIENKVIINGHEMKQDGYIISFGCAMFKSKQLRELLDAVNCWSSWVIDGFMNRKIKSITLDSDVTITVEQLKQIVDNIK
jgi:hypothetical protein